MSVRESLTADVWKGATLAGRLTRTEHGGSFQYTADYVAEYARAELASVAFMLPVRAEPYPVFGTNLHTFFAGLLPEGLRLRALVRAVKTSEDDLFSLLLASGADTVGDVAVAAAGSVPRERTPLADTNKLESVSFRELLASSLDYGSGRADATVAGVQPKVSAAMISFPVRSANKRREHILKLSPAEFPQLVENELFFMNVAHRAGLTVAATRLVRDRTGEAALLVERFDRTPDGAGGLQRLHQEDACQLLDRYPADKYRLTLSQVADALDVCSAPVAERLKLIRQQAFSYAIANGDLHGKNISVRTIEKRIELTPAYDLVSTLPYGDRAMALAMEGRDDKLKAAHFVAFGERVGVRRAATVRTLRQVCSAVHSALPRLSEIGLSAQRTRQLEKLIAQRVTLLSV